MIYFCKLSLRLYLTTPREGKVTGILYIFKICRNKISFLNRTMFLFCIKANLVIDREAVSTGWGRAL